MVCRAMVKDVWYVGVLVKVVHCSRNGAAWTVTARDSKDVCCYKARWTLGLGRGVGAPPNTTTTSSQCKHVMMYDSIVFTQTGMCSNLFSHVTGPCHMMVLMPHVLCFTVSFL